MEQQFSVSWKNFHGNLSNGFAGLLENEEFVDVTLACDGQLLQAHKVVLSICSPYFKRMFQANPCQHPIVVLRDVSLRSMKDLIHFMYNGEVSVRQEDLAELINTAETLEIKGLTSKHRDEDKVENVPNTPPLAAPLNNNVHIAPESNSDSLSQFPDDLTKRLDAPHNPLDLNSIINVARKRKSESYNANNFYTEFRDSLLPEKRTKLREKQILNRHKISNNYPRGNISVKNFDTHLRSNDSIIPSHANRFEPAKFKEMLNNADKNHKLLETGNSAVSEMNGRHLGDCGNEIKKENEEYNDVTFEDNLPKSVITYDQRNEAETHLSPSPKLEQDGVNSVELPVIAHASWPMLGKSGLLPTAAAAVAPAAATPAQHTITTIPQKEDGKKKYPQRSCRFCWKMGKRRDTRFMCQQCSVPLCKSSCFEQHQIQGFSLSWKEEFPAVQ